MATHNYKPHNPQIAQKGGPLCWTWGVVVITGLSSLRAFERDLHTTCPEEDYTMTPLLQMPWTQPTPTLPLDVLDSCNNAQVRHL